MNQIVYHTFSTDDFEKHIQYYLSSFSEEEKNSKRDMMKRFSSIYNPAPTHNILTNGVLNH